MDRVEQLRTRSEDAKEALPLMLANYQAPVGIYLIFNFLALIVFFLEVFLNSINIIKKGLIGDTN